MLSHSRQLLHSFVPPLAGELFNRLMRRRGFFGNYSGWEQACRDSTGYDQTAILEHVRDALLKVKNGEAAYERDSVLFEEIYHSWPLLAGLLWIASCNGNRLNLIDYGGSLGSSYFQNRSFLSHLEEFAWNIVEQEHFVRCGREMFEDQCLKFYYTLEECLAVRQPDAILLSSVLPYLEDPHALLSTIIKRKITHIIIDRTPVLDGAKDRLTVQRVPAEIYDARYPAWFLGREKLLGVFERDYELVMQFDALAGTIFLDDTFARDKGFIFRLKSCSHISFPGAPCT
ncbi:TIGR04325 family methyltransferase [Trichlorobacter lovleyi]|uniref:TIGR04325 family methyltransferase n=1 Tax=Trichlorobacter lovleyi TaxID=313985 RepID=UPI0023F35874|nr:TIGR04325 family methyltransferase [Trichlorobacter lovleyi]